MLKNFQIPYNNTSNFLNASHSSTSFPPVSPGGGMNVSLSNALPLQNSASRVGNTASASATNQSNPPTPTDQNNATMSPNRKNSKKVNNLIKSSKHFYKAVANCFNP